MAKKGMELRESAAIQFLLTYPREKKKSVIASLWEGGVGAENPARHFHFSFLKVLNNAQLFFGHRQCQGGVSGPKAY